jgi:CRP-like cAMP-binding protein
MPYDCLYLIFEGQVSLITGAETDRQKVLECIGKNRFFGELALIDDKNHLVLERNTHSSGKSRF